MYYCGLEDGGGVWQPLRPDSGPELTATKAMGTLVLQLKESEFCQQ